MARILKTGSGWRVGWDESAPLFQGLIGGDDWAFELTQAEFQDFGRLLLQLTNAVEQIAGELMDEEQLQCDVESECLWLEAFGEAQAYSVKVMLNQGRRAEGSWDAAAVPGLLHAIQSLNVF